MHIVLKDQRTGEEQGILCVERNSSTCIVLRGEIDQLNRLVGMATAMHIDRVIVVVDDGAVPSLLEAGWKVSEKIVLEKCIPPKKGH